MMNSMRKMAGGFVAKLLMLFLIITFGLWGISDVFRESGGNYAARVGNETISLGEFSRQKALSERRAEALGIKDVDPRTLDMAILRRLIQQRLVNLVMKDLGLYANTTLLAKTLREEPTFKNKDGSFNKGAFLSLLQEQRITEADVLNQIKDDVNTTFLMSSIDVSDVSYPDSMRALIATAALETRDAWIITISPTSTPAEISEAKLKEFYEQNKSFLYVKPESRTLEYVVLRQQQIESAIDQSITDQMIDDAKKAKPQASTEDIKKELRKQQREQGLRTLEAALDDALAGGATLSEALSKANLSSPIKTLNNVSEKDLKAAEDDVIKTVLNQGFQMGDGETSNLILSQNGTPIIVHVKSLIIAGAQEYEAVQADVRKHVAEELRSEAAKAKVQEVKEALSKITGNDKTIEEKELTEALAPFGLKARPVKGLARPTGTGNANTDIPLPLQHAIFERQTGTVAGPLTLANGNQMLAIVSGLHHPDATAIAAKNKQTTDKERKQEVDLLSQAVQARSFSEFTSKHRVKVNTRLLTQNNAPTEEQP